jgi:hypothetical protein
MRVYRTDLGVTQTYYGLFNASTNPGGRDVAGWYNTEKSQGLVPVVPTSVSISGGSATVNALGEISFSGTTALTLNNIFTSQYRNYRIIIGSIQPSTGQPGIQMRFTNSGGTPETTAKYYAGGNIVFGGSSVQHNVETGTDLLIHNATQTVYNSITLEIREPQVTDITKYQVNYSGYANVNRNGYIGGFYDAGTQFAGIQIYASTGTQITGNVIVYGYNR